MLRALKPGLCLLLSLCWAIQAYAQGLLLLGVGVSTTAPAVITLTFIGSVDSGTIASATSNTFTAANIGTAAADRLVVVACTAGGLAATQIPSLTIGGVAATLVTNTASLTFGIGIFALVVAAGTTANIVCTSSSTETQYYISVWTITGYVSATAENAASTSAASGAAAALSFTPSATGVAVYMTTEIGTNAFVVTWSGGGAITQDGQANFTGASGRRHSEGHITGMTNVAGTLNSADVTAAQRMSYGEWH